VVYQLTGTVFIVGDITNYCIVDPRPEGEGSCFESNTYTKLL